MENELKKELKKEYQKGYRAGYIAGKKAAVAEAKKEIENRKKAMGYYNMDLPRYDPDER